MQHLPAIVCWQRLTGGWFVGVIALRNSHVSEDHPGDQPERFLCCFSTLCVGYAIVQVHEDIIDIIVYVNISKGFMTSLLSVSALPMLCIIDTPPHQDRYCGTVRRLCTALSPH